jgi:Tfp pilus assembly protein PilN
MIKINLLPQKRAKRAAFGGGGGGDEASIKEIVIGAGAIAAAALLVFILVDQPKRSKLNDLRESNEQLDQAIAEKNKELEGYAEMKKAAEDADQRAKAINRLMNAKVVPANVLHELSEIMMTNHTPTMTDEMAQRVQTDPNKRFDLAWDPTKVWLTSFADDVRDGSFRLEGGAQAEQDIIQLSKRLQASVYFDRVSQQSEERVTDRDTGVTFYHFVITGKVAY